MFKSVVRIGLISFLVMCLNACAVYYRTSDVRFSFDKSVQEMDRAIVQAKADYRSKKEAYDQVLLYVPDAKLAPYPSLAGLLQQATAKIAELDAARLRADRNRKQFDSLFKGEKQIRSDSPHWDRLKELRKKHEAEIEAFKTIAGAYQGVSNTFSNTAKRSGIVRAKIADIRAEVARFTAEFDRQVPQVNMNIDQARGQLRDAARQGADPKKVTEKNDLLDQLEQVVRSITEKRQALEAIIRGFESEVDETKELWIGPGMKTYTVVQEVQGIGRDMSQLVGKYNGLVERLEGKS